MALTRAPQRISIFDEANPEEALEFDAVISEVHSGEVAVTDHPIERGADITDHIKAKPDHFRIQSVVSDHPIVYARSSSATPAVAGGDPDSRSKDAYEFIRRKNRSGALMGLATRLRKYSNMIILSYEIPVDATKANMADITLLLREMKIAETDTVAAPVPVNPARKKKTKRGKKQKAPATKKVEEKNQSLLYRGLSALGKSLTGS